MKRRPGNRVNARSEPRGIPRIEPASSAVPVTRMVRPTISHRADPFAGHSIAELASVAAAAGLRVGLTIGLGVGVEERLAEDLDAVGPDLLLGLERRQPLDELPGEIGLDTFMQGGVHWNHSVRVV